MLSNSLVDDWVNPNSPATLIDDIMQFACDYSSLEAYRVVRNLETVANDETVLKPIEDGNE